MTKILVIEDELAVREIIVEMLCAEKFDVIHAADGQAGVQLAQAHSPDLIICDIMMPNLDGYGVLTALRQQPSTAIIPFIFLTAKISKEDLRQGMELGADDYLTKPFTRDELLQAVRVRFDKQAALIRQYMSDRHRAKDLETKVQNLQQFTETRDEIFHKFSEDLRQSVAKINMSIRMLQNAPMGLQQQRYLEILQQECDKEITLLNHVTELRSFLTPDNLHILHQYNLLRKKP